MLKYNQTKMHPHRKGWYSMEERTCYSIGETAAITGISTKTLRYYDSVHLVTPEIRDPQNSYRYYSDEQVIRLLAVQRLRCMGCSQQMLRTLIQENSLEALCRQMELRIQELEGEIAERTRIISESTAFLQKLKASMALQALAVHASEDDGEAIRVEEVPRVCTFWEERVIPDFNICTTSIPFRLELYGKCRELGLTPLGPEISTYYTELLGQFVIQDCRMGIGIVVEEAPIRGQVRYFGGFTAVTSTHIGSYDTLVNTHLAMLRWIRQNGYALSGPVSDEFLISPIDALDQKNQVLRTIMPVEKRSPEGRKQQS